MRHNDDLPLMEVLRAVVATRDGRDVNLVALRCSVVAKGDQIQALARTVTGLEPLTEMTPLLLAVLDDLDSGDVDAAIEGVDALFRRA